jgi:hypothetical protein
MIPGLDKQTMANAAAEEVLQAIYGDDLAGCPILPETIASVILRALAQQEEGAAEIIDLYEKAIEALHLLSTPPAITQPISPEELRALLGDRLDSIHTLTQKLIDTTTSAKARISPSSSSQL